MVRYLLDGVVGIGDEANGMVAGAIGRAMGREGGTRLWRVAMAHAETRGKQRGGHGTAQRTGSPGPNVPYGELDVWRRPGSRRYQDFADLRARPKWTGSDV